MMNFYKKSKKSFIKNIKRNPYITREEWNNYAHENNYCGAFTLEANEISDETLEKLYEQDKDVFEFLKDILLKH